ncbi:50S ribosomal protein L32 [Bacteroides fragilis]|nr:50S ribosomal protein L32 [Bacteroides fragilis]RGX88427.1 50S ribosomal protein L32 [Bacteroides fragilis]
MLTISRRTHITKALNINLQECTRTGFWTMLHTLSSSEPCPISMTD